jgi:phosphoribosyl 1,2-cyclic phosphate phosphodiesterase
MQVVILGCGTAGGTPRIGNDWGACDPTEPRNQRRRASVLLRDGDAEILIDASPDLRQQGLDAGIERLDAVLFTHAHADHAHGIDDLRFIAIRNGGPVDAWADPETLAQLEQRFGYTFEQDAARLYPPILNGRQIVGPFEVAGSEITPFRQEHGPIGTTGFRVGGVAYSTDVQDLSDEAFEVLAGVDTWIVDCLQRHPHPTHAHLELTLSWIERVRPRRAVLTHMNTSLDYQSLLDELPTGVEPGYDGMVLDVSADPSVP